jgi:hypothetical protein
MPPPDAVVDMGVATELEGTKAQPPWSALPCRFRFVLEAVWPLIWDDNDGRSERSRRPYLSLRDRRSNGQVASDNRDED